ncbi:MAG: hypothetical protein CMF51_05660 [Legionellales bacterium]|nr:hypothetical protein [Legionellales bacterium]
MYDKVRVTFKLIREHSSSDGFYLYKTLYTSPVLTVRREERRRLQDQVGAVFFEDPTNHDGNFQDVVEDPYFDRFDIHVPYEEWSVAPPEPNYYNLYLTFGPSFSAPRHNGFAKYLNAVFAPKWEVDECDMVMVEGSSRSLVAIQLLAVNVGPDAEGVDPRNIYQTNSRRVLYTSVVNLDTQHKGQCVLETLVNIVNSTKRSSLKRLFTLDKLAIIFNNKDRDLVDLDKRWTFPAGQFRPKGASANYDCRVQGVTPAQVMALAKHLGICCYYMNYNGKILCQNRLSNNERLQNTPALYLVVKSGHMFVVGADQSEMRKSICNRTKTTDELVYFSNVKRPHKSKGFIVPPAHPLFKKQKPELQIYVDQRIDQDVFETVDVFDEVPPNAIIFVKGSLMDVHSHKLVHDRQCWDYLCRVDYSGELVRMGDLNNRTMMYGLGDCSFKELLKTYRRFFGEEGAVVPDILQTYKGMVSSRFPLCVPFSSPYEDTQAMFKKRANILIFNSESTCDVGVDVKKCYTRCLYSSKYPFLVFGPKSFVEDVEPEWFTIEEDCMYYVAAKDYYYGQGCEWYCAEYVEHFMDVGMLTSHDIKYKVRATHKVPPQYFRRLIQEVYDNVKNTATRKTLVNCMIGCFRRNKQRRTEVHFTNDLQQVQWNRSTADRVEKIAEGEFMVMTTKNYQVKTNQLPFHSQVLDLSVVLMHKIELGLAEQGHRVVGCKTDCWFVQKNGDIQLDKLKVPGPDEFADQWFGLRLEEKTFLGDELLPLAPGKEYIHQQAPCNKFVEQWDERPPPPPELTNTPTIRQRLERVLATRSSGYLGGPPGAGKSYLIEQVIKPFAKMNDIKLFCTGPTWRSVLNIGGDQTLSKMRILTRHRSLREDDFKDALVVVDEVSMMQMSAYEYLFRLKKQFNTQLILVGDYYQCMLDSNMRQFPQHPFFRHLVDGNLLYLRYNKRDKSGKIQEAAERLLQHYGNDKPFSKRRKALMKSGVLLQGFNSHKDINAVNICFTHRTKVNVNRETNAWFMRGKKATMQLKYKPKIDSAGKRGKAEEYPITRGTRLICKRPQGKNGISSTQIQRGIISNEFYTYIGADLKRGFVNLKPQRKQPGRTYVNVNIEKEWNQLFRLGWCDTTHSVQGMSIDEPYTVWDANLMMMMDLSVLYTAVTRATAFANIHIAGQTTTRVRTGAVYMITNTHTNMKYIGSVEDHTRVNKRWAQHQKLGFKAPGNKLYSDMFHYRMFKGIYTVQTLHKVQYTEVGQLHMAESRAMHQYDTLRNGLNALDPCVAGRQIS